ncbi:MAG: helix-turn-helix domain-containing protein [Alphaproteobacteria bacterium]
MSEVVAQKIREHLDEKGWSISATEKKAGLKVNSIRNILSGHSKKPSADSLLAISNVLGCSIYDILGETNPYQKVDNSSSQKKTSYNDYELLKKIVIHLIDHQKESKSSHIDSFTFNDIVEKMYRYSTEVRNGDFDLEFFNWFMQKK